MGSAWRDKAGSLFTAEKQEAVASRGMVAANHPLAAAAGLEMLAMGGNAIDAAVATVFALTVVEPMMVSIFGAGFVNFYDASTGNSVIVDNYTVAPTAATPDMYIPVSDTWPLYLETVGQKNRVGYLAVAVPGALKSWCYLEAGYGRLDLETVLQPAIRYAARRVPRQSISESILSAAVSRIWHASRPAELASCPMGAHRVQDKSSYAVTMHRRCSASLRKVLTRSTMAHSETWSCVISRPMVAFSLGRIYEATASYAGKPCAVIIAGMRLRQLARPVPAGCTSSRCSTSWSSLTWRRWALAPQRQSMSSPRP